MNLIPDEEVKRGISLNLAPMVDFLFVVLAVFATMAITRSTLFNSEISLVKLEAKKPTSSADLYQMPHIVNITITNEGSYKWTTEINEKLIDTASGIKRELYRQQENGILPLEKKKTKVLLHIDRDAKWESIAQAIFSIREAGFEINPVYEVEE